jgi:hypothetical protein
VIHQQIFGSKSCAAVFLIFALAICPPVAARQENQLDKRNAVVKMLRVTDVKSKVTALYKNHIALYTGSFPAAAIEDFEGKGMFKRLPPDRAAKMKELINEFGKRLSLALQQRVVDEVVTDELLENTYGPLYEKHFTLDEIHSLTSFYETPDGKRMVDRYAEALSHSLTSSLANRGFFKMLPSPDDEVAKLDKIQKELREHPLKFTEEVFSRTQKRFSEQLTEQERQTLIEFWATPAGGKVATLGPGLMAQMLVRNQQVYASRVGALTRQVYNEQMEWFGQRTREILGTANT